MDRRQFHAAALAALLAGVARGSIAAADEPAPAKADHAMPAHWMGHEQIALLVYPGFTALDLIGPQYLFSLLMGAKVKLVAKSLDVVKSDTGVRMLPDLTFADCPQDLDLLFCPGGTEGTLAAMQDAETLDFLADRGRRAKWVTSVCTGSLLLGAAGLLRGYRATSHWVARDLLVHAGATPVKQRVVRDRNRLTGAGVTAGLDFGLTLIEILRDRTYAECSQLLAEYDPQPPFRSGSVETASAEVHTMMADMFKGFVQRAEGVVRVSRF
jgi:putative intracellular protease/amidase